MELLDYARRLRLYIENNKSPASDSSNLTAWLEHTMVTSTNEQSYSFYSSLLTNYKDRHSSYTHLLDSRPSHTKDSLTESLSFHDSLWNEADKGRGLTLLTTDQLKSAEDQCISQLKGQPYLGSQDDLQATILKDLDDFYEHLDGQQKWLISSMFGDLKAVPKNVMVPFLNLK